MKVISIRQPWADAIIHGGKDIENRNWATKFRGRILIHASKKVDYNAPDDLLLDFLKPGRMVVGGMIGSVTITDCVEKSKSKWFDGPYGFVLKDPEPMKLYPCNGQLGIWEFVDEHCQLITGGQHEQNTAERTDPAR